MKKHLFIVTFLVLVLLGALSVQASPIAFKEGDWKLEIGGGKATFDDGTVEIMNYPGWKLLQRGANSNAGQFSLAGYTGIELEVKVEEPSTFEIAIQLDDWGWNVVSANELSPEDGWVLVEADLSGLDLSKINALCIQASNGDFSMRNIQPTPVASAGAESKVKLSGKAELNITAKRIDIVPNVDALPTTFKEGNWYVEDGTGDEIEFGNNSMVVTGYPGWGKHVKSQPMDMTGYTGFQFEFKRDDWTGFQIILNPGYVQVWEQNASGDDWHTVKIDFAEHGFTDLSQIEIWFQYGSNDLEFRNIVPLPMPSATQGTDFEREYGVELGLNYTINDDWEANVNATVFDETFKAGLVEVKGTAGDLNVRAFVNGTGANIGDPMNIIKGEKFYEDKTAGIDFRMPISVGSGHMFLSTPVANPGKRGLIGGSFNATVADSAELRLLGATEFQEDPEAKRPYLIGSALEASAGGVGLAGEVLTSGKKGLGLYGKVSWKNLEAAITRASEGLWTNYSDHNDDGYGTYHVQGNVDVLENLNLGLYFNQWYNLKPMDDGKYKNYMLKPSINWEINENAKLDAFFEYKKAYDFDKKKYNKLEDAKLVVRVEGDIVSDLNGKFISIMSDDGEKLFKVPAYVGRLTYTGLDQWTFTGEAGLAKTSAAAKLSSNLHAKAKWAFDPSGSLEFAAGRATLNDDDDAVSNASTAKHYYTVKFTYTF